MWGGEGSFVSERLDHQRHVSKIASSGQLVAQTLLVQLQEELNREDVLNNNSADPLLSSVKMEQWN